MIPATRKMVITLAPGSEDTPMLCLAEPILAFAGFELGTPVEVIYEQGLIRIKKLAQTTHVFRL